jgi:hypothetical protein
MIDIFSESSPPRAPHPDRRGDKWTAHACAVRALTLGLSASAIQRELRLPSAIVELAVGPMAPQATVPYLEMPAFCARRTRSATVRTPSFSIIRLRCTLMIFSTVPRSLAICLLSRPATMWGQHFAFARRQRRDLRLDQRQFGAGLARLGILCLGSRHGCQ